YKVNLGRKELVSLPPARLPGHPSTGKRPICNLQFSLCNLQFPYGVSGARNRAVFSGAVWMLTTDHGHQWSSLTYITAASPGPITCNGNPELRDWRSYFPPARAPLSRPARTPVRARARTPA